ncbi:MAG: sensor histidine kinase [Actinophytocola sp.]|uniref:sensor histidine kinase n=1 Tax=Actinophytocola sp. TaxID=1872138 RepID=UPI003D6B65E5
MPDPELVEVRASRARIVDATDALRRKLERDLHDGAQQRITSVVLALGLVGRTLDGTAPGDTAELVAEATAELNRALAELRELARDLYPVLLTDAGLGPALASLADRCPVPVVISDVPPGRLAGAVERTCYFVVFEALRNVAVHSFATRTEVAVRELGGQVRIQVSDDGVGGADPGGPGLRGLADRVAAHGGRLWVDSERDGGTRVMAELPCA